MFVVRLVDTPTGLNGSSSFTTRDSTDCFPEFLVNYRVKDPSANTGGGGGGGYAFGGGGHGGGDGGGGGGC